MARSQLIRSAIIALLTLLVPTSLWAPPLTANIPYEQWKTKTVITVMAFLQQNRRKYIRVKLSDQSFKYVFITKGVIGHIADCAFIAAELNPSWGHCQEEVAGKLICVNWVESGFDAECLNMQNRFGTVDVSWMQINSCNWQGVGNCWDIFCSERSLDHTKLTMLWDLKTNMMFAAWLNERFIKGRKRTYSYGKKPIDLVLYNRLMEIVTPPEIKEIK